MLNEPLTGLFTQSRLLPLDFSLIPLDAPGENNIQRYFEDCKAWGLNPRLPENRQRFNDRFLQFNNVRYAVSQYAEDRSAMLAGSQIFQEGRVYHLGIDVFSRDLEPVYAPCDGRIVVVGREPEEHSFGYFSVLKPENDALPYVFFGHLGVASLRSPGPVCTGDTLGILGDFIGDENGGWSRHLHLQMLRELPPPGRGPLGYSSLHDLERNKRVYPNPLDYFPLDI